MWFPLLVRLPFAIAGIIAGWFFTDGTLRYDVVQMAVALVMFAAFCACMVYAPTIWRALGGRRRTGGDP
ncbi:hypothetical protein DXT98_30670 [Agrobacterium sp. ICMP 7243]|nr:hypothetical protein DXT98_30670 [Agrobacterium sp. ICMP 7243]NTG16322.1 hypothetical protein [Rhizobium rhizogenes]NTG23252.1 hypothetical protein [Rhizobium rhizogenes]NTH40695.1 hypothetical protein [Rhizobium rhizogenes]NTJ03123.1 hypothetical protein [Rhizobium rhizogenes]